ncbi:ATP-dependent DNA ligase [Microbacterium panaciterrae]
MGKFTYETAIKVDIDDRILAHLQAVIGSKFRRGEAFFFSWRDDPSAGDGRTTVWLHPQSSLVYKFYGSRLPQINRAWVEALAYVANSPGGLYVVPEPAEQAAGVAAISELHVGMPLQASAR